MMIECTLCGTKIAIKNYNTFSLEGLDYNIKKVICNDCAKRLAKFIAQKDKRVVTHTILQVLDSNSNLSNSEGVVFRLTITVDNEIYFVKDFNSYTDANNFILPLVKLKNRYSKQVMLDKLNSLR